MDYSRHSHRHQIEDILYVKCLKETSLIAYSNYKKCIKIN